MLTGRELLNDFFEQQHQRNAEHSANFMVGIEAGTYPMLDMTSRRKPPKRAKKQFEYGLRAAKVFTDVRSGKTTTLVD
jgi:hypothetical protein